jgi:uncharacterized membrane protein YjgN (DUF898 family)
MKKILFFIVLPILLFNLSVALSVPTALAQGPLDINNQEGFGNGGAIPQVFGTPSDLRAIVANIIVVVLGFLAIIFVSILVFAGFRYMTSMGNEEQTGNAIKQIVSAVIGLVIILMAYAITSFVFSCVVGASGNYIFTADICGLH